MFDGFSSQLVPTPGGEVFVRAAGEGPALLLLHGYPQTHLMWHGVVQHLATRYSVVVADLPGYGRSYLPPTTEDHLPYSKRSIGRNLVAGMSALGFTRFAVAGHDRGGRVAYRMALDHPDVIDAVGVFDIVPTGEVWRRADAQLALAFWHWSFLAQPAPLPEHLIGGNPDAFFDHHVRTLGLGTPESAYPPDLMDDYRAILDNPDVVHAICEDYRAGAGIDREHDDTDAGTGHTIACPLLVLWSATGALPRFYGDVIDVWRPWAANLRGRGVNANHFIVEALPDEVARELVTLLDSVHHTESRRS